MIRLNLEQTCFYGRGAAQEHGLVATDAIKGSVVDFGKPQEAARNIGNDLAA
jgi:hypothetical protein